MKKLLLAGGLLSLAAFSLPNPPVDKKNPTATDPNTTAEVPKDNKLVIYQLMTRLFGNKVALNKPYGTIAENGCGKFNDITDKALDEIKKHGREPRVVHRRD